MKRSLLTLIALGVGTLSAVLLIGLWRQDRAAGGQPAQEKKKTAAVARPDAPVASAPAQLPEVRTLLSMLQAALSQANSRAREALLTFKDDAALQRFRERAARAGVAIVGELSGLRTIRVRADDFAALQNALLDAPADVSSIAANYLVNIPSAPPKEDRADVNQLPFRNETLSFLGVTGDHSDWGRGTTIAILDTGVAPDATFGTGRLRALDIGLGTSPGSGSEDGHGTAVAALAAGRAADAGGVAPAANLLSIRVTDAGGTSDIFTLSQAIVAAVDAGAKILNVSLGGYSTNATLGAAIAYAGDHGALIVAAAGNDQAAQLAWPAADARVLSVGAVDRAEQQVTFSNSSPQLQISAPGYGVQTAWSNSQRVYVDGTSASAPLVSGAIAAVMSLNPSLTPQQAAQLITRTASDAGAPGDDPAFGNGILNLGWAVNSTTPGYVDTAVSSHYYDAAANQMDVVVQNRSAQTVSGLALNVGVGTGGTNYTVPTLAPGEIYILKLPVDAAALKAAGTLTYTSQLTNPPGLADRVPGNNRKSSTLTAPGK